MLLNQASNKTHTQVSRERERAYCPSHCHTKFDRHLKHIYNKKKKERRKINFWQWHRTLALQCYITLSNSTFNIGRKTSVKTFFDCREALSNFTP